MAAETYFHNIIASDPEAWARHQRLNLRGQIDAGLAVAPSRAVIDESGAVEHLQGTVDLLAGGPPCQGFSLAGRRRAGDSRNELPWEFLRIAELIQPRAVLIENVPGIGIRFARDDRDAPLHQLAIALNDMGYVPLVLDLDASLFGVPQRRPRTMLVGVARPLARRVGMREWREDESLDRWRSSTPERACAVAPSPVSSRVSVSEALADLGDDGYVSGAESIYRTNDYARDSRDGTVLGSPLGTWRVPSTPPNHELRSHSPDVVDRFRLYQAIHGTSLEPLRLFELAGRAEVSPVRVVRIALANAGVDGDLPPRIQEYLAKSGHPVSAQSLATEVVRLKSRKHSQRLLVGAQPSPTVMSLPDDFIHPYAPRTLSVREMARLQSFPDGFVFKSKATTGGTKRSSEVPQYTQVGNAVPPLLATAVGRSLKVILSAN